MPCAQKVQDLPVCICKLVQITAHKLILYTESVTTYTAAPFIRVDLIKFTCRLDENTLGDQGVKAICESLKAMRNLQVLE